MKKLVLLLATSCVFLHATAQDSLEGNNYVAGTIGRSLPVGEFASNNVNRINAGLAKNGWNIEIKYAHRFDELFGFSCAFLYAQFPIKMISANENPTASIKPFEYYELLIGPMITGFIGKKISLDLSILTGTAYINATKVNLNAETIARKYPASAIPIKCAVDLRFRIGSKLYFMIGPGYNYLRANMNATVELQELSFKQSLNTVTINTGFGVNFK